MEEKKSRQCRAGGGELGYYYLSKEAKEEERGEFGGGTKMSRLTLTGTPRQYSGHYDIYRSLKAFVKRQPAASFLKRPCI